MKAHQLSLAVVLTAFSAGCFAADAPAPAKATMPANTQEWISYLSDFTRNGDMLADPKKFLAALSVVSEPQFLLDASKAMMEPNLYLQSTASLMDPRAYGNFAKAMDPAVLAAWTTALMDPQFISATQTVVADPGKLMRWVMMPLDPKLLALAANALNPNVYLRLASAPLDPRVMNMATAPVNPNWYGAWMGGMASPQSYGPTMGTMLRAPYVAQPMPLQIPMMPMLMPPGYK
jgi:hypothetical protein